LFIGEIDFNEFKDMITKTKQVGDPDSDLREAFKVKNSMKNLFLIKLRKKLICIIKHYLFFNLKFCKVFDIDGDGIITHKELRLIMNSLGQQVSAADIDEMIKEADTNCICLLECFRLIFLN